MAIMSASPSPIQTGMVDDCDQFDQVLSGDTCSGFATDNDISLYEFYAWNPAVGTDCARLYLSYYVCVGVDSTTTAPATTSIEAAAAVAGKRTALVVNDAMITPAPKVPARGPNHMLPADFPCQSSSSRQET